MIDTHCHLDFEAFDHDRTAVLDNCEKNGVHNIIVPAVTAQTFARTIAICENHAQLHLALGLHPIFIDQHQPQHLVQLDEQLSQHPVIAVGEIGLDYYRKQLDKDKQNAFFTKQLIIAKQHGLPVIIHNRKAHDECLALLAQIQPVGGIIHAFNGSIQQAEKYIELGFLLGFGGMLTFDRSAKLKTLAKKIPLSSIVLETDAPDMAPEQHRGERNSPEYLPFVQTALANIKGVDRDEVAQTTSGNAQRVFNLPLSTQH